MDEKTEELRDIFMDVTDEAEVTEHQSEGRGSLADVDEETVDERIDAVVERLADRYAFETDLAVADYREVVRGFYDGDDDATIAETLGTDAETVFRARLDLHLLTDADTEFPFDLASLRRQRDDDPDPATLAAEFDATVETVERALAVARTQDESRRVSERFRREFEEALPEAALSVSFTESVTDDGLDEAAEDIETNVDF